MFYGRIGLAHLTCEQLLADAARQGISVEEHPLEGTLMGLYDHQHHLIIIEPYLSERQRRCTLYHELMHAAHGDELYGSAYDLKAELRTKRLTAQGLINDAEYASAELVYEARAYLMACELDVTMQVLCDYQQLVIPRAQSLTSMQHENVKA